MWRAVARARTSAWSTGEYSAADARHDVCQGKDSCGLQGAWAAKSGAGSLLREPLAGCVHVHVLEEGWECPFCETEALHHGPVALDSGEGAEVRVCVLRRFVQGSAGLSSPPPSPGCCSLVASGFCCHARDVFLHGKMFCDCGHRELHRLPTSLVDLAPTLRNCCPWRRWADRDALSSRCDRKAFQNDVHGHVAMGTGDVPSVNDATRDWHPFPVEHTDALQHQRRTL